MESTYIRLRIVVLVPLGCNHSILLSAAHCLRSICWSLYPTLMSVALTTVQMAMVLSVQLVLRLVVQLPPVRLMTLHLPWRCHSFLGKAFGLSHRVYG